MKYLRALIYIYCYVELVPGGGRHLLQLNLPRYSNKCEAFLNTNISSSTLLLLDKVWNCCETSAVHFWKQMWFHLKYPPEQFIATRFCNRSLQFLLEVQISSSSPYSDNKQANTSDIYEQSNSFISTVQCSITHTNQRYPIPPW